MSATSRLSAYLGRSAQILRTNAVKSTFISGLQRGMQMANNMQVARMDGVNERSRNPITLFTLNSHEDLSHFATGCDADIGGTSTVNLTLEQSSPTEKPFAKFWGNMRLGVHPQVKGVVRGGYAGFRNKVRSSSPMTHWQMTKCKIQPRPTLFGDIMEDVSNHKYLALRVRSGGNPRTRNSYFVNLQTDGPISTDLWQHRLFFRKDGQWEDVFVSRPISPTLVTTRSNRFPLLDPL